jgi:hypothetical protein
VKAHAILASIAFMSMSVPIDHVKLGMPVGGALRSAETRPMISAGIPWWAPRLRGLVEVSEQEMPLGRLAQNCEGGMKNG